MEKQIFDKFKSSLLRCLSEPGFLDGFYQTFIASSPEVARAFAGTDMDRQKAMLNASLYQLMTYYESQNEAAAHHIETLGASHGRYGHNILPGLYDLWLESLIHAVRQSDKYFDPEIEAVWRDVMGTGIAIMKAHYEDPPKTREPRDAASRDDLARGLQALAEELEACSEEAIQRYNDERNPEAAAFQFGHYRAYLHASELARKLLAKTANGKT